MKHELPTGVSEKNGNEHSCPFSYLKPYVSPWHCLIQSNMLVFCMDEADAYTPLINESVLRSTAGNLHS